MSLDLQIERPTGLTSMTPFKKFQGKIPEEELSTMDNSIWPKLMKLKEYTELIRIDSNTIAYAHHQSINIARRNFISVRSQFSDSASRNIYLYLV